MDLRALSSFVVVAEELHFGRAAARLHLSQPALSQQIKRLETELGVALLSRDSRNVALTAAGQAFVDRCSAVLGDVSDAIDEVRRIGDGRVGHLRVGYVGSTLYGAVPRAVAAFRATRPSVELSLVERKTAEQIAALDAGTQDVGFIHVPEVVPDELRTDVLMRERLQLAMPAARVPNGDGGTLHLATVAAEPFVLFPRALEPDTYDRIVGFCAAAGFAPRVAQHATGLHTLLGLVAAGVGCAFVTDEVARHATRPGLVYRPVHDAPTVTTALAWHRAVDNPTVAPFLDVARDAMADDATA